MTQVREKKNLGGRPRKEIDLEVVKNAARIQATADEVASLFDMSVDTLDARLKESGFGGFSDFYKRHSGEGKISLRREQYRQAMAGDTTMLIWLGKQWLGQRTVHEVHRTDTATISVEMKQNVKSLSDEAVKELIDLRIAAQSGNDEDDAKLSDKDEAE